MKKIFFLFAVLLSAIVTNLNAANVDTLYLNTGGSSLWNQDGAKFSVFYWNDGEAGEFSNFLTPAIGETDIFRAIIPRKDSVIFVRHASTADVPAWGNKLNQTKADEVDLEIGNIMVITGWEPADREWDYYTPKKEPDTLDYLHFVSLKAGGSVKMSKQGTPAEPVLEYSKDNRKSWSNFDLENGTTFDNVGDTIWFRAGKNGVAGTNATISKSIMSYFYFAFGENDSIAAGGNIMSLLDGTCNQDSSVVESCFTCLFYNAKQLVSAPKLPATKLAQYCYASMFRNAGLVVAPELPATKVAAFCYMNMFNGCANLETAPDSLPAKIMTQSCYNAMFNGCANLKHAPTIKITNLHTSCFQSMFEGCTKLKVDTISASCDGAVLEINHEGSTPESWNYNMFAGCKGSAANNIKAGGHYCIKEYIPALITLTFDMQGHGEQVESQTIASGSKVEKPETPQAEGYEFRDWFSNAKGLGEAFDFNQAVTADKDTTITIYAKWRDPVAWEQFKKDLDTYSYVEYDSTYMSGFKIHLATAQDAQVQDTAFFIEASEEVLANYNFERFVYQLMKEYPLAIDELNKCVGEEAPIKPGQNPMLALIAAYTQLPYRANGLNAVSGLYSSYIDLVYKEWAETNYENDAEICKCMFNSDVFFKGTARMMEAFDASEK